MFKNNLYYSDGKKVTSFGLFIAPIAISIVSFPLIAKYPVLIATILVSLAATIILSSLCFSLMGLKANRYFKKNHFQLWKKSKSRSFWERREAQKEINSMVLQIPYLEKPFRYANKIAFILFVIWTLIFLGIFSFIIFSAVWD